MIIEFKSSVGRDRCIVVSSSVEAQFFRTADLLPGFRLNFAAVDVADIRNSGRGSNIQAIFKATLMVL